jgi:hypothetical protein
MFTFGLEVLDPEDVTEGEVQIPSVEYKGSRTLFEAKKDIDLCVLKNEIIVYGIGDQPDTPKIWSYDIIETTRRSSVETDRYNI